MSWFHSNIYMHHTTSRERSKSQKESFLYSKFSNVVFRSDKVASSWKSKDNPESKAKMCGE